MKRALLVLLVLLCLSGVAACNPFEQPQAATLVAEEFYDTLQAKDFAMSMDYYSPTFFTDTLKMSKEDWQATLARLQDKLGDLQEYDLANWKVTTYVGTGTESGTYYTLEYEVTYSKYAAKESVNLFKPQDGSDKDIKIVGHTINSAGLLQ